MLPARPVFASLTGSGLMGLRGSALDPSGCTLGFGKFFA